MKEQKVYAQTKQEGKTLLLHRMVMATKLGRALLPSEKVEFINGNTLDCRSENLRLKQKKDKA